MRIAAIEDLHCNAGWRDFSFLKITTDDGLVGWSEYMENFGAEGLSGVIAALGERLIGMDPRPVEKINWSNPPADAPTVDNLLYTSPTATLELDRTEPPHSYPLACAVEQKTVVGGANRDFLNATLNWLLDRSELLNGIGPQPVTEFRLVITTHQQQQLRWLLLGALPGAALLLGWLVWLTRRQ